jgi:hypothetical protein
MSNEHKLAAELQEALDGGKGALDCWLEATSEDDARAAILTLARRTDSERRRFAAMAMQGFCANPAVFQPNPMSGWSLANCDEEQLMKYSKKVADALLAALEQVSK